MKSFENSIAGGNFNRDAISEHWEEKPKSVPASDDSLTLEQLIKKHAVEVEEVECGGGCGKWGEINYDDTSYFCGGGPSCCP